MNRSEIGELEQAIADKDIALVGNAESLLGTRNDIDSHEVVIRINRGSLVAKENDTIGKRTDILLISGFENELDSFLAEVPRVVWMSPKKRERLPRRHVERLSFYPLDWWAAVHEELGHRPSTGCMGIDLVSRLIGTGRIHLYGFDFWKSPTSYTGTSRPGPHDPVSEEVFARQRVPAAFSDRP